MNHRIFPKTGWKVSEVGLGCWQIGGDCWGDLSEQKAYDILSAAVDSGVTFLDTADVYGAGRSEEFIGNFLKSRSESLHIATKLGRRDHVFPDQFTEKNLRVCLEDSLSRLGVPIIELAQLHCPPAKIFRNGNVFKLMSQFQSEGLISNWGASVESMEEALICLEQPDCVSLQIIFNIFRQKPISILFEKAKEKGVGLIVRLPLASGLLSGKMQRDQHFAENDHRKFNCDGQLFNVGETFAGLPFPIGIEIANKVKSILPSTSPMAKSAIRWILDHDAVTTVIPGASSGEQAKSNAAASDLQALSVQTHEELRDLYEAEIKDRIRGPY
jgi:aryl-alcohol dehydrogenase-like predicted oxidoreductase